MFLKKCKINNENEFFAFCNIIAKTFTPNENLVNDISEDENSSDQLPPYSIPFVNDLGTIISSQLAKLTKIKIIKKNTKKY